MSAVTETRPPWRELFVPIFITVVLIAVPELPGLRSAVAFDPPIRIPLALLLLGAVALARFSDAGIRRQLGLVVATCVRVVFLVATDKPGTLMWVMTLVAIWGNARAPKAGRLEAALSGLEPGSILLGFLIWGRPDQILVVPTILTLIGPTMHLVLSRQARRIRTAEDEAQRLHMASLRAEADLQRAKVLSEVHQRLGAQLREISELAQQTEGNLTTDQQTALASLATRVRDATIELRGAIWALDPADESWETIEARLRRVVGDESGLSFTSSVPPDHRLSPTDRVSLVRSVREALAMPGTRGIRIRPQGTSLVVEADGSGR